MALYKKKKQKQKTWVKLENGLLPCLLLRICNRLENESFPSTYLILLFLLDIFKDFLFNLKKSNSEEQLDITQSSLVRDLTRHSNQAARWGGDGGSLSTKEAPSKWRCSLVVTGKCLSISDLCLASDGSGMLTTKLCTNGCFIDFVTWLKPLAQNCSKQNYAINKAKTSGQLIRPNKRPELLIILKENNLFLDYFNSLIRVLF